MGDLPNKIMVWHSDQPLDHVGTWATTRYPEDAEEYVKIAALPDMVVPLVWHEVASGSRYETWVAIVDGKTYTAWGNGNWRLNQSAFDGHGQTGTIEAAKAAAQAHYVATIMQSFIHK